MRANAKKKEGQRNVLPPQLFNGETYCGDYDDFDVANEDDELEEFLGLPRKTPKVVPGEDNKEKEPASEEAEAKPVEDEKKDEEPPAAESKAEETESMEVVEETATGAEE